MQAKSAIGTLESVATLGLMIRSTESNTDLTLSHVSEARHWIDPIFLNTPQYEDELLCREVGRHVVMKIETSNPIRSFKARGVSFAMASLLPGAEVICASSGNFGQAVAYVARSRGLRARVFTPHDVNAAKRARMEGFGARIDDSWESLEAAWSAAAEFASKDPCVHLLTDGVPPSLAEGAATIAQELTRTGALDAVVVPIGDGSLISGIGLWMREYAPRTRVIGVNPASAPAMQQSRVRGTVTSVHVQDNFAEGISIHRPHLESLHRVLALVDDIVLVNEAEILDAMATIFRHLSIAPEPAGAAGLAAITNGRIDGQRVATILTGANIAPDKLPRLLTSLRPQVTAHD